MQTKSAIAKLEKAGLKVGTDSCGRIFADTATDRISFWNQNGEVVSLCTTRHGAQEDLQSDYFPQRWHDSMAQALKSAGVK